MSTDDSTQCAVIPGEQTEARVMGLDHTDLEDNVIEQIQAMANHEAFQGNIRVMPDCHVGSGATIGFTMDVQQDPLRICPNTVGVDIGCGMYATKFSVSVPMSTEMLEQFDRNIRYKIPMGRDVHDSADYHMGEDFPWDACTAKWHQTKAYFGLDDPEWFDGYGLDAYFKPLCERVEYDPMRAINSVGTLGGGNHFIEIDVDEDNNYWVVLHSGSRGIGLSIAEYWQERATQLRTNEWIRNRVPDALTSYVVPDLDDDQLTEWFLGGMGRSYIDSEAIRAAVDDNHLIEYLHNEVRQAHPDKRNVNEDLDYLEGQEAAGYLIDMIFAQTYAMENRRQIMSAIHDVLGFTPIETVHTPHNLVDFEDFVLRKGAVRAHEDEKFVLPFNMADGTFICEGTGNEQWNRSCAHGAGRVMSRTQAYDELDVDEFESEMADVYSTSVTEDTLDEAPAAYKPAELVADAIEPTASVVHELEPVLNIKALE